jgi:hypothetical protein
VKTREIIKRLERLKVEMDYTLDLFRGGFNHVPDIGATPNTFHVGDFTVTDRQWTQCQCKPK